HLYLNRCAGFTDPRFGAEGDPRETMTTQWYHDHCVDFTAQNVYRGNAGIYYQFNANDTGDENDPSPDAWRLPSAELDIPLASHDQGFDDEGKGLYDLFNLNGNIADTLP